jgi:ATP-dependent Lon protease
MAKKIKPVDVENLITEATETAETEKTIKSTKPKKSTQEKEIKELNEEKTAKNQVKMPTSAKKSLKSEVGMKKTTNLKKEVEASASSVKIKKSTKKNNDMENIDLITLPLLPLRDVVVFPHMAMPLFIGRAKSIQALEYAMQHQKLVFMSTQINADEDEPKIKDLYPKGCIARVLQMLKLPDGTVKVLIEGQQRGVIEKVLDKKEFMLIAARSLADEGQSNEAEQDALMRIIQAQFEQYAKLNKKIPAEILSAIQATQDIEKIADLIAAQLPVKIEQKQRVLESVVLSERLELLLSLIESEIDVLQVEKRIRGRVKRQMEKSQREYYLNEQVKAIQKELGEGEDGIDFEELDKKIKSSRMHKEARKKAENELKKLRLTPAMSAEATVIRSYLDTLVGLPWRRKSKVNQDLINAQEILDADHYGLEKVKERIIEYLAVQQRVDKIKAPILCLVGPPGVGKTSLGQSIAKATNRKFVRMALGGVRDEAEIRGHRRTYIGSMPGKILQNMAKVEVRNPLFLLDEIDKMGSDFRGDPASALLEVLDPEQNHTFQDHYLEVDFDLSDVMFIATSNSLNIPPALLDRMEIIRLAGYTEDEKFHIAHKYLIPKQIKQNGLTPSEFRIDDTAIYDMIRYYTREAGVRGLEREISKLCRKVVTLILTKKATTAHVSSENIQQFLGVRKYDFGVAAKNDQVGQVTGLAWTEVGGELLTIEAAIMPGKAQIIRTGNLGDVMKESVEAARSVVRSRIELLGIDKKFFDEHDIHIHVPEGATPKDGPSAGIAMTTAVVSVLTKIPVCADIAMTGEITLRGEVLAIGGLKEKLLAALRGGIKRVLIPQDNFKDLDEIPANVKADLTIIPVKWVDEVLKHALSKPLPVVNLTPSLEIKAVSADGESELKSLQELVDPTLIVQKKNKAKPAAPAVKKNKP